MSGSEDNSSSRAQDDSQRSTGPRGSESAARKRDDNANVASSGNSDPTKCPDSAKLSREHVPHSLEYILSVSHINAWNAENIVWPGLAVTLATAAYTATEMIANKVPFGDLRPAGELVGAGGILLCVVMFASLHSKLTEWHAHVLTLEHAFVKLGKPTTDLEVCADLLNKYASRCQIYLVAGSALVLAMVVLHVYASHSLVGTERQVVLWSMLLCNVILVLTVRNWCLAKLYKGKSGLLALARSLCNGTK